MKLIDGIKNNSLLIIPSNMKEDVIRDITKLDGILNIKYITFNDIENRLYSYSNKAINYLMNKYRLKYNVACVYLDNIRYIEDKLYNNKKLDFLVELRCELLENNLIEYKDIEDYQYENIIIYGYSFINKYRKRIIKSLESKYNIIYIEEDCLDINNKIYEFNSLDDEVVYVCESICKLIRDGIDINNIKIIVEDSSYYNTINNIFSLFNLKTSLKNRTSIYLTSMGKYFCDNIDSDIDIVLENIKNNFDMNDSNNIDVYNKIIKIINKYEDKSVINNLIIEDFKKTFVEDIKYDKEIEVISIYDSYIRENDYVFLMGFNQRIIPRVNKEEGFFSDKECLLLEMDTTIEKNKIEKEALLNKIRSINNLVISYKLHDNNGDYLISNLNDYLDYEIIKDNNKSYLYSNRYNNIRLSILIDNLVKYGIRDKDLGVLYNNYKDIKYLSYDNKYKSINKYKLLNYLDNKLLLSYTSLTNYYECSYKYYLANILKLNIYEKTYKSLIGDVFHYILSICFDKDIDISLEYDKYLESVDFEIGVKERYFFDKLKEDLLFVINTIKEQYKHSSLNNYMYEKKIVIEKVIDNVSISFMGVIDKLMYKKFDDREIVAIIDYKTGSPDINLNNIIYGLDMQLPIYLYLAKNIDDFNNPIIVGFYLQKLLDSVLGKDYKKDYNTLKKEKLMLNGYSIDNMDILEEFDDSFNKSSVIKSMSVTSKGSFSSYSKVISEDNINKLNNIISDNISKAINDIMEAKFDINPKVIGKENKGCKFCKFYDICYVSPKDYVRLEEKVNILE